MALMPNKPAWYPRKSQQVDLLGSLLRFSLYTQHLARIGPQTIKKSCNKSDTESEHKYKDSIVPPFCEAEIAQSCLGNRPPVRK